MNHQRVSTGAAFVTNGLRESLPLKPAEMLLITLLFHAEFARPLSMNN